MSAKAVYVCTHDKSHVIKYDATVTSVIAKEPALGSPGKKVYTASYDDHSETKEEELNFITGSCKEGADYRLDVITGEMVITGKGVLSEIPYKDFVTSVTVGEGITAIAEDTFKDCLKLESVVLPDTLTTIGSGAFENCPVLEEIIIPESVTSIADDAVDNWEIITTGIKSVTGKAKKVKVIWKKVPKAIGYLVYRATSINGKYSKIATIKKATTLSYTDKKAKAGVTYYYKVKPVYSVTKKWKKITSTGAYSKPAYFFVFKAKPKISSTKNGVITWKKVSKATGYEVYRSLDKKTYELLGTTTTVKFTDTDIVPGVTYYYKVRALRDTDDKIIYSGYSAVKSYKKALATPTIKSAVYNKETKQIDIVVNEAKEAALGFEVGYDIQVSTSKKKGFKSVVITDNIGVKAITKKGTYYIKVRTYIVYNGKKYYSSYSKLKTLKVTSI